MINDNGLLYIIRDFINGSYISTDKNYTFISNNFL